jgi:hypothetical protein
MAIKLLYEMSGALPRVCAALVADLSTHSGALEASALQGQVCVCEVLQSLYVRERMSV